MYDAGSGTLDGRVQPRLPPVGAGSERTPAMTDPEVTKPGAAGNTVLRWLPIAALAGLMALAFAMGWHKYLSFQTIGLNYQTLKGYIALAPVPAFAAFVAVYIAVAALSLPGASIMTLTGGLLFGWQLGALGSVIGASIGATALFLIVQSSFGATLAGKAGPFVASLRDGFRENALAYLLFLRLVPAFPFFVVNLVPALLGVPLSTFVIGTTLGIIPATVAFSLAAAGLGSAVEAQNAIYHACMAGPPARAALDCPYTIDFKSLVTPELIYGGIAIGIVALIPVFLNYWSKRHATA